MRPRRNRQDGVCDFARGGHLCPAATEICDVGSSQPCDVCATCGHTTIQAAIAAASSGETVRICAGSYICNGTNRLAQISGKNLILAGALTWGGKARRAHRLRHPRPRL